MADGCRDCGKGIVVIEPLSLISFFAPIAVAAGKAAIQKYIAPDFVKPITVQDKIALDNSDTERLKVVAALDNPGENVSLWVANCRALMRPTIAVAVTIKWCIAPQSAGLDFMVSNVWFYLFGERTFKK